MTAPADVRSAGDEVDDDLRDARAALGRRLSSIINELSGRDSVLLDMVWDAQREPAWFDPARVWVTINGAVALADSAHPDDVDPLTVSGRLRHPVIIGMCGHEAAHARSTRWSAWPRTAGRAAVRAAVLLEEPRIEARHLQERPGDRVFLRAAARHIVLPEPDDASAVGDRWRAATGAALVLGRVDAGVLTEAEVRPVYEAVEAALGADDLAALRALWREALDLRDGDQEALLSVARRWVDVVGAEEDEDLPGVGCAAGGPSAAEDAAAGSDGDGSGSEEAAGDDVFASVVASVAEAASTSAQIATGALPDPEQEQRAQEEAARRAARAADEEAARAAAQKASRRVFAPAPTSVRARPHDPVVGRRAPTSDERAAARRLGRALREAQFREPVRTRVSSALPPGRLSGRDAMLGAAQRSLGLPVTARPFRSVRRQQVENPPVALGVAVDVSGSMRPYTGIIASTSWVFAHAAREVEGVAATCAFGSAVTPIVSPGVPPAQVTRFSANDGNHRFTEAARALDGALTLAGGAGARVLVIVSDGHWEPAERGGGARVVKRLADSGVHVLWFCLDAEANVLSGARRAQIAQVSDIPSALSAVLVKALRSA
ncbi:VWA domain-containing protein [Streptomyces nanshensis]|uniref:VWFA domain-containing protein n=1 Tax=Streptomyces nanshensis TaxID=518642 RepID=A0A1E7KZB3_9ACTN|nr:VWA domain-containing protein [Streptomyces nanshensis]OEV09254.1 hypothetical protein AN218_22625 [Streptomyces nanshensis]